MSAKKQPSHVISAGVVPIYQATPRSERLYLCLRAYRYWDFPKGRVAPGEALLVAALRELAEESGITEVTFPWGEEYHETEAYGAGKVAHYFVGKVLSKNASLPINPELGFAEHQEYRWCTYDSALKILSPRLIKVIDWADRKTASD